jgi:hypothetical protein
VANGTLALDYSGDGKFDQLDESFVKKKSMKPGQVLSKINF